MPIQKIKAITIENFKNVKYGEILFVGKDDYINVTGIYGQNGSGKTAVVDCFSILKKIFTSRTLPNSFSGMLSYENDARITLVVDCLGERENTYFVRLKRTQDDKIFIAEEKLTTKWHKKGAQARVLFHYHYEDEKIITTNKSKESLASLDALKIIKDISITQQCSFLFFDNFRKIVHEHQKFLEHYQVLELFRLLGNNIFIYTSEYSGLIGANILAPVGMSTTTSLLPFNLDYHGNFVPIDIVPIYENVIEQLNIILPEIIPGLNLEMIQRENRVHNNEEEVRLEFIAKRDNQRFSLSYESDGIKKIIGLVLFLVEVYNRPDAIAVIDEFDSGIFEYLLGELLEMMQTGSKGQLIFTSHNLRILEMLPTQCIIFSTINPSRRYIRLKGVKPSNNLRDFYLRTIQLGGQEEELYEGKPTSRIRLAFLKAGEHRV